MNFSRTTSITRSGRIFGPSKNPLIQVRDQLAIEKFPMKENSKGKLDEVRLTQLQEQSEGADHG